MSKVMESRFRVLDIDHEDVMLSDLEKGLPVHVAKESSEYEEELQSTVDNLNVGYKVEAEILSESISLQDDYWEFLELSITDRTRLHFIDEADIHPSIVEKLEKELGKVGQESVRTALSSSGTPTGYITVAKDPNANLWNGLKNGTRSHERDLENVDILGNRPHEVLYTRKPDKETLVFYHIKSKGKTVSNLLIERNK